MGKNAKTERQRRRISPTATGRTPLPSPGEPRTTAAAFAELRRQAEERLRGQEAGGRSEADAQRLIHELEIHQIELEMQNEELQRARAEAETLLAQYTDLYEFAPTGYFNLARDGKILAVNLTGARFVGIERAQLVNRRFALLVAEGDRSAFKTFLERTFASQAGESCEVAMLRAGTEPLFVRVEAVAAEGRQECRAAVLDVTARHQAEAEQERLIRDLQRALANVKLLTGLLPICAGCKKIRDDQGYWSQVESYIQKHSQATFSHGLCPDCSENYFPDMAEDASAPEANIPNPSVEQVPQTAPGLKT